jgi:hypothetical protein
MIICTKLDSSLAKRRAIHEKRIEYEDKIA